MVLGEEYLCFFGPKIINMNLIKLIKKIKEKFSWDNTIVSIWIGLFAVPFLYSLRKYNWNWANEAVFLQSFKNALWVFIPVSIFIFGIMKLLIWVGRTLNDKY